MVGCSGGAKSPSPHQTPPPPPSPPTICVHTFMWENPTEDMEGNLLAPTDLTKATLYMFRIPMAGPEEVDSVYDAGDPYTTMWMLEDLQGGTYYYRLTVSSEHGESDYSNEVTKTCP